MIDFGFYNMDCMKLMQQMENECVDLTLTDIPYEMNNELMRDTQRSDAIRQVGKGIADKLTFDIPSFLDEVYRVTKGTIIIFCGANQLSEIYNYFKVKQFNNCGTVRQLIWEKTNPSPMNGQYVYLSGIENAVYFKKRSAGVFNAFCQNTVFRFPTGSSEMHPTEKNHDLLNKLIADNSDEGQIVFDTCAGSGSTLIVANEMGRKVIGCELNPEYYEKAKKRFDEVTSQINIWDAFGFNPYQE